MVNDEFVAFQTISDQLQNTAWHSSDELVGGVPTAALWRLLERRPEILSNDNSENENGPSRDNLLGKVVIFTSQEASSTKQNGFRPYCSMGAETWPGRMAADMLKRSPLEDCLAGTLSSPSLSWTSSVALA